ncbi:hypothetical protein Hanom_Chr07g00590811 [Helianthus anomalus]
MGFFSFILRDCVKKLLLVPPKSFHNWQGKFFFIKDAVTVVMTFRGVEEVEKEDILIPKTVEWYMKLRSLPSQDFGEKTLGENMMFLDAALLLAPLLERPCAWIPGPKPCRAITLAGEKVVMLSSEEFMASFGQDLTPPHRVSCVGSLPNLGVGPNSNKSVRAPKKELISVVVVKKKMEKTVVVPSCRVA